MPIAPPALVEGAKRIPLPYGLFSTVAFRENGDRWENGVAWETLTCDPAQGYEDLDCAVPPTRVLDSNSGDLGEASVFTVYGHYQCSPTGNSPAQAQAKATDHLLLREEMAVEKTFWDGSLGNNPTLLDAAVVVPTVASFKNGIGALEEFIATDHGGQGVIHMSRVLASLALSEQYLIPKGQKLQTALGTPVAAGAGYPGTAPTAGLGTETTWIYASPTIFGYRGTVETASNRAGDLLDRGTNDLYAVAERGYLLGYDPCGVAAIEVDLAL